MITTNKGPCYDIYGQEIDRDELNKEMTSFHIKELFKEIKVIKKRIKELEEKQGK